MKSVKFSIMSLVFVVMFALFSTASFATVTVPMELKNQFKAMFVGSMVTSNSEASAGVNIKQAVTPLNISFERFNLCEAFVTSLSQPDLTMTSVFVGSSNIAKFASTSFEAKGYVGFIGKCVTIGD